MRSRGVLLALVASVRLAAAQGTPSAAPAARLPTARVPDSITAGHSRATIAAPPASLKLDTSFYAKYTDDGGIPIISSAKVPDAGLYVARDVVLHMTSKRLDVREAMARMNYRVGVMSIDESTTDVPEQRGWKKPAITDPRLTDGERANYPRIEAMTDKEYWDRRARGMGGRYTTCAEENILGYPGTRYYGENILVHEFSHGIMAALRTVDPPLFAEVQAAYAEVKAKGMYRGQYAINTIAEYWAEGTQWWFWSNFAWNHDGTSLWSPDDLKAYDPKLYAIFERVYPDHHVPMDVFWNRKVRSGR